MSDELTVIIFETKIIFTNDASLKTSTQHAHQTTKQHFYKQSVALTGRNTTGPPCSVGRPTAHAPGGWRADRSRARRPAGPPAALHTTTDDDRRQPAKQYWPIRRASNSKPYTNIATIRVITIRQLFSHKQRSKLINIVKHQQVN